MEGLKLIDLGNEVSYIDVDTSKVPYTFSVKLGDRTFAFSIRYNEVGGFFTVDLSIASTGEVLVYGDIVRYGRPLFNSVEDERFPVPVIMPLCLTSDDGIELLIHVGMDTVEMQGKGFKGLVKEGEAVKAGTPLLTIDLRAIKAAGYPATTAVIVTNSDELGELKMLAEGSVSAGTPLIKF